MNKRVLRVRSKIYKDSIYSLSRESCVEFSFVTKIGRFERRMHKELVDCREYLCENNAKKSYWDSPEEIDMDVFRLLMKPYSYQRALNNLPSAIRVLNYYENLAGFKMSKLKTASMAGCPMLIVEGDGNWMNSFPSISMITLILRFFYRYRRIQSLRKYKSVEAMWESVIKRSKGLGYEIMCSDVEQVKHSFLHFEEIMRNFNYHFGRGKIERLYKEYPYEGIQHYCKYNM